MPSILQSADKEKVKRAVPSSSNKIITVAVARLYVNYPNRNRWNYTGICGAVVLSLDKVGKTHFFKIIDVSVGQEISPLTANLNQRTGKPWRVVGSGNLRWLSV